MPSVALWMKHIQIPGAGIVRRLRETSIETPLSASGQERPSTVTVNITGCNHVD